MSTELQNGEVSVSNRYATWPLLRGRLQPPQIRSGILDRPRVRKLLDNARNFEVVQVAGPSGYGKTTAVAQWMMALNNEKCLAAWISLDEMDSGASRIIKYLVASLSQCDKHLARSLEGLFDSTYEVTAVSAINAIVLSLEEIGREVYLVVDDLHGSLENEALEIFSTLVNHGLPNLHVVLILRDAIKLPVARAKMRRSLLELGPAELQFTLDEAEDYFSVQKDIEIGIDEIRSLCNRTDGWIAGLQLASLSLRGHDDPKGFIDTFSGSNRDVGDLLAEEVLFRLPPDMVSFLEQTAVLSSFSADLCDELLERKDSALVIQQLEDGNLFIFPMDDERTFYRYHRLFSEHLQRNLEGKDPERLCDIHRFATHWFREHQLPLSACLHAAKTDDMNFLAEVLASVAENLRELGHAGTVMHYAAKLPPSIANQYPVMQLVRIFALTVSWRFDEAWHVLEQVRSALTCGDRAGDEVYAKLVHREGQLALFTDDHKTAERLYTEWLELDQHRSPFEEAIVRTSQIYSRSERYEFKGLEQAVDIRKGFKHEWATVWHDCIVGACYFNRGDLATAEVLYRRALSAAHTPGGRKGVSPGMPGVYLAELLYEQGNTEEASVLIEDYLEPATEMGMPGQLAAGYVTKARLLYLRGDDQAALNALDMGIALAERRRFRRLHNILMLERYRILLDQGNAEKCLRIARTDGLMTALDSFQPDKTASSQGEPQALAWASISLVRNKVGGVSSLLDRWRRLLVSKGAIRPAVQFSVLGVRAALIRGDKPKAIRLLHELLGWSSENGFVRSIINGGTPVLGLLQSVDVKEELIEARRHILHNAGLYQTASYEKATGDAAVEPLNARETQILNMVERGLMNKEIAAELGLTVGTVKWYMQQIFEKLGVNRRSQAIHTARHLGFIR